MKILLPISFVLFSLSGLFAQRISVSGNIYNEEGKPMFGVMILNLTTGVGTINETNGSFKTEINKNDSIAFAVKDYKPQRFSFKDSASSEIKLNVVLFKHSYQLNEVTIYPIKKPQEIHEQIKNLGVKQTNTYKDFNSFESPITYLYERFSRKEQSKRVVAELENQDKIKQLLKDLFRIYVAFDIIELNDNEFESFIYYLNINESVFKSYTDYELAQYIRNQYAEYRKIIRKE